jgi:hypothetical protein
MTHAGQVGTSGGNSSQRGQRDYQGPPHPSACLPHVCLDGHTVRYDRITFVSVAHEATQFVGPHKIPYARVQMNLLEFISLSRI